METSVFHVQLDFEFADSLPLKAADDAVEVGWRAIGEDYTGFYSPHVDFIKKIVAGKK